MPIRNPKLALENGYRIDSVTFDLVEATLKEFITGRKILDNIFVEEYHPNI